MDREAEVILRQWHHVEPGMISTGWRCFQRGDAAWEAATYAVNVVAQGSSGQASAANLRETSGRSVRYLRP